MCNIMSFYIETQYSKVLCDHDLPDSNLGASDEPGIYNYNNTSLTYAIPQLPPTPSVQLRPGSRIQQCKTIMNNIIVTLHQ